MANNIAKSKKTIAPYLVGLILIPAILFSRLATSDFTWWDDTHTVHHNPYITQVRADTFSLVWKEPLGDIYIPITYSIWAAIACIAHVDAGEMGISLNPYLYHLANIIFHILSGIFIFLLIRKLVKRELAAFIGALLYLLHPYQVESVGWVSGLKDVLAGCFTMGSLLFYVKHLENKRTSSLLSSFVLLVIALLSKPSAMTTPLLAAAIDYFYFKNNQLPGKWLNRQLFYRLAVISLPCIPIAILARHYQNFPKVESPLWARPMIFFDSIGFYLYKYFVPIRMTVDYGRSPTYLIQTHQIYYTWIPAFVLLITSLISIRQNRWVAPICFLIFIAAPIHVLGLTRYDFQYYSSVADHYMYVAILGPALLIAWLTARWQSIMIWISTAILTFCAALTYCQTAYWVDDLAMLKRIEQLNDRSEIAMTNIASFYIRQGDYETAIKYIKRSKELSPESPNVVLNSAMICLRTGDLKQAKADFEKYLEMQKAVTDYFKVPPNFQYYLQVADEYFLVQQYDEAEAYTKRAEALKPDNAMVKRFFSKINNARIHTHRTTPDHPATSL